MTELISLSPRKLESGTYQVQIWTMDFTSKYICPSLRHYWTKGCHFYLHVLVLISTALSNFFSYTATTLRLHLVAMGEAIISAVHLLYSLWVKVREHCCCLYSQNVISRQSEVTSDFENDQSQQTVSPGSENLALTINKNKTKRAIMFFAKNKIFSLCGLFLCIKPRGKLAKVF